MPCKINDEGHWFLDNNPYIIGENYKIWLAGLPRQPVTKRCKMKTHLILLLLFVVIFDVKAMITFRKPQGRDRSVMVIPTRAGSPPGEAILDPRHAPVRCPDHGITISE